MTSSSKGLSDFVAEAAEILEALNRALAVLDQSESTRSQPDLVNGLFRSAHSLKGLASIFGEQRIAELAHGMEDLLDRLRLGRLRMTDLVVDALLDALDACQLVLAETSRGEQSDAAGRRIDAACERLAGFADTAPLDEEDALDLLELDTQVRNVLTEYEEHRLRENLREKMGVWKVRAVFELSDFDRGLARLTASLKTIGEVISTLPSADPGDGTGIAFDLIFASRANDQKLRSAVAEMPVSWQPLFQGRLKQLKRGFASADRSEAQTDATSAAPPQSSVREAIALAGDTQGELLPSREPPPDAEAARPGLTQTVRVDIGRLDSLMDAVGELLLIKANVARLAEEARAPGKPASGKLWGQQLHRESQLLERKLDDLQKGILDVRMVPLGQIFDKLARAVRRIARESNKEVEFVMRGAEVEVDKLIVEALSDPLMHLVRNAVDHGIETVDERERRSKRPRAVVSVSAAQRGSQVVIEVADDGRGLDDERIRQVAVRTGIVSPAQAPQLAARDLHSLIFLPGFSTAGRVSAVSGRGVGLDVVKTNISRLSGMIDTHSEPGRGATFTITLPETLAIVRALVVAVSSRVYAVPLNSVTEITSITDKDVKTVERREVVALRGKTIPLARLARLFEHPEVPSERRFLLVVGLAHQRLGLAVDELLGQQDVVVKPLPGRLRQTIGIAGATDLGDRKPVLVLDPGAIIEEVVNPERRAELV